MTEAGKTGKRLRVQLSPRQERFVREYLRTGNAKRSAVLAGYSPRSSKQIGSSLLRAPAVNAALEAAGIDATPPDDLTPAWALQRLVEETADPNPRVRLDAKKAVAQAVGLFALTKDRDETKRGTCARCGGLEGLDAEDLQLVIAGTNRGRVVSMSAAEFERWVLGLRAEAERWIQTASNLRAGRQVAVP